MIKFVFHKFQVPVPDAGEVLCDAVLARLLGGDPQHQDRAGRLGACHMPQKRCIVIRRHQVISLFTKNATVLI